MANEEVISLKKINGRMFIDLIVESTTTIVDLLPLPDGSASPAQSCGLRVGDTIVAIGGVSVVGKDASFITGRFKSAGETVELRVQHMSRGIFTKFNKRCITEVLATLLEIPGYS